MWADKDSEMNAVEVQGMNPKYTWEIIGIYRAPYEDMRVIERLAARIGYSQNSTKHSIRGGDLILAQEDWNGRAEGTNGNQAFINRLVQKKGYMQVIGSLPRQCIAGCLPCLAQKLACLLQHCAGDQRPLRCMTEVGVKFAIQQMWKD